MHKGINRLCLLALAALLACATPATQIPVTLTAPPPTPTVVPLNLAPPVQVGASSAYVDGATLLAVPSGPFMMGHGHADDPEHTVTLSDFWIYSTEVTNAQYANCVAQGMCTVPDAIDDPNYAALAGRNQPVVGVTYQQAQDYCASVNASLPTEAQWEKAARGPDGNPYPWGSDDPACDLLNYGGCVKQVSDVTQYAKGKSYYGALNLEGNVYEWVADWYDPLYYKSSPPGDPPGPDSGKARVVRSSSFLSNPTQLFAYARSFESPRLHRRDLGFRCAVKNPTYFAPACNLAAAVGASESPSLKVDCPQISIDVATTACRYGGGALVTFNDDHPQDPNASFGGIVGCKLVSGSPGSFPLSYQCRKASTAVLTTSCVYSGISNTSCPPHYDFNAVTGVCDWEGARTSSLDCTAGDFFDPIQHCCRSATGSVADDAVCPVGTVFTRVGAQYIAPAAPAGSGQYFCLPGGSSLEEPQQTAGINPPVCPGACELSEETCSQRNLKFCSTLCTCISVGLKCPTH